MGNIEVKEILDYELTFPHKIFHTTRYVRFLNSAFKSKSTVLGCFDNGVLKCILPVTFIRGLFGKFIVSTGFLEYGGFAGDSKYFDRILEYVKLNYSDYGYLEIRGGVDSSLVSVVPKYKRFELSLSGDVFSNIQKDKRKAIKKSLDSLMIRDVPISDITLLYKVYLGNMRSFGSPPYSIDYFRSFYDLINLGYGKILGAYFEGRLVGALVGFIYSDRAHIVISVYDSSYQQYRVNDGLHWKFIEYCKENGLECFDFGRVRLDSGQFEYKRKWGGVVSDLSYSYLFLKKNEVGDIDPTNSKFKFALAVWKKMPLWFTSVVGRRIREMLGI